MHVAKLVTKNLIELNLHTIQLVKRLLRKLKKA